MSTYSDEDVMEFLGDVGEDDGGASLPCLAPVLAESRAEAVEDVSWVKS
jgi:hypothetical protein